MIAQHFAIHQDLAYADYLCGATFWRVIDTIGLHDTNLTQKEALSTSHNLSWRQCLCRFWIAFPRSLKQLQKAIQDFVSKRFIQLAKAALKETLHYYCKLAYSWLWLSASSFGAGIDVFLFVVRWGRFKPEHDEALASFALNCGETALRALASLCLDGRQGGMSWCLKLKLKSVPVTFRPYNAGLYSLRPWQRDPWTASSGCWSEFRATEPRTLGHWKLGKRCFSSQGLIRATFIETLVAKNWSLDLKEMSNHVPTVTQHDFVSKLNFIQVCLKFGLSLVYLQVEDLLESTTWMDKQPACTSKVLSQVPCLKLPSCCWIFSRLHLHWLILLH